MLITNHSETLQQYVEYLKKKKQFPNVIFINVNELKMTEPESLMVLLNNDKQILLAAQQYDTRSHWLLLNVSAHLLPQLRRLLPLKAKVSCKT